MFIYLVFSQDDLTSEVSDFKSHLLDLTLEYPQIRPIYDPETEQGWDNYRTMVIDYDYFRIL